MSSTFDADAAPARSAQPHAQWAITHAPSHARLWIVAGLGLAADLWTKHWAFDNLEWGESRTIIDGLASFQLSLNPGALFGLGQGWAPIFVGASVLALMFVLYLFANATRDRWSMHVALGCVLAGALGNLYDRTTQSGYVVHMTDDRRVVGKLVEQTDDFIRIGSFPGGNDPMTLPRVHIEQAGPEPVVRDFVKIEASIAGLSLWPWIFNIADALLVVGVGVLMWHFMVRRDDADRPRA